MTGSAIDITADAPRPEAISVQATEASLLVASSGKAWAPAFAGWLSRLWARGRTELDSPEKTHAWNGIIHPLYIPAKSGRAMRDACRRPMGMDEEAGGAGRGHTTSQEVHTAWLAEERGAPQRHSQAACRRFV